MHFGPLLRSLRKSRELTQVELAAKVKVSQSFLARLESGKGRPSMATVRKLIRVLEPPKVGQFITLAALTVVPKDLRTYL